MKKAFKNYLKGFGSVIDIMPATDFHKHVPQQSPAERLHGHFRLVFDGISRATDAYRVIDGPYLMCEVYSKMADEILGVSENEKKALVLISKLAEDVSAEEIFDHPMPLHMTKNESDRYVDS